MKATADTAAIERLRSQLEGLLEARRYAEAEQSCQRLLQLAPSLAEAHFLRGMLATELRQWSPAITALRQALSIDAAQERYWTQLARLLALSQRIPEALDAAEQALRLQPQQAWSLDTLGVVYSRANLHARAATLFRQACGLEPGNPHYQFNLASALKFLGDFDSAETAYEACLSADPGYWKAYPPLSQLRTQTPERNHRARYEALLPRADSVDAQLQLHMALAKECEDLGEPNLAFQHLLRGKSAKRASLAYDCAEDARLFSALHQYFAGAGLHGEGVASPEPIFVVGMPRTGTTLVERILSSHTQVHSAGELQNLGLAIKRASGSRTPRLLDAETLAGLHGTPARQIGEAYLASTRPGTGHTPRFVDKMPLNFLYAGFIAQALPKAKIICLRRHPLDTCLSNFRQLFALQFSYYNYSYDLLDTGRYYLLFERLMEFWQQRFPGAILELQYEALVAAPEAETRRLLDWCGLPWEDACLHFERNAAPVSTASAVQVRQPIYRSSVDRWKQLATELQPLRQLLLAGGVRVSD
ncbi:sulfotransferase family protein [Stagnimonas aquatica]|uniref:Sulfotransferase family protein n=1 Tax=Stagnimonas aquatica TaxID=2689987 RepID=A0A3N0VK76_9GAMM|nr:sulfotransferase [Stagnimonas aquatica]ROH93115.1 sulfotransferase family protein [Stagnimonas aquatica]